MMRLGVLLLFSSLIAQAENAVIHQMTETFAEEKSKILSTDQKSRDIMRTLYEINLRMRGVSKKRDALNNRMLDTEGNVKTIARQVARLELKIQDQRSLLSKRLRAIYMLGEDGPARMLFSASNSNDIDQTLKYLRIISDHDYKIIKNYESDLKTLKKKRESLRIEVRRLVNIKSRLRDQEDLLSKDQSSKSQLLSQLRADRERSIAKVASLRSFAKDYNIQELLNDSFFEQKGKLIAPVRGQLDHEYGLIENGEFHYRLSHKGHYYRVNPGTGVRTVFAGTIAFIGNIDGYGRTVIVDHGDHYYSVYAKADHVFVREGDKVKNEQVIGKSNDGLYFEIRHFSDAIDPKPWLKQI